MSDPQQSRSWYQNSRGRLYITRRGRARRPIPYVRRLPNNRPDVLPIQPNPVAITQNQGILPIPVVRPPLNLDLNAPGPHVITPGRVVSPPLYRGTNAPGPNQAIPPTQVLGPPLVQHSNRRPPISNVGQVRPNRRPFALRRTPLNARDLNARVARPNHPTVPMWRAPATVPPNAPGRLPTFRPISFQTTPHHITFRHRFPQMYVTVPQSLPRGTLINLFHPSGRRPFSISPRNAQGFYTLNSLFIDPPRALGERILGQPDDQNVNSNPPPTPPTNQPPQ
jgi:hypothetical protein